MDKKEKRIDSWSEYNKASKEAQKAGLDKRRKEKLEEDKIKEKEEKANRLKSFESDMESVDAQFDLGKLKVLVEQWILTKTVFESIKNWGILDDEEIREIFEKIDCIENIKDIDNMLPKLLRISKEEYIAARNDENSRQSALQKIDNALTHLYHYSHPWSWFGFDLFSSLYMMFDKNLRVVQENTIDIKYSLEDNKIIQK